MDSIQIHQTVSSLCPLSKIFSGIFPIDKINKIPLHGDTAVIINTAPSTHKGKHWVAMINLKNKQEYFDSYGISPPIEIKHQLEKRGKYTWNKIQTQGVFSATCGAHCIFFLFHRSKGFSMQDIVKKADDKTVTDFVNNIYSPYDEFDDLDNIVLANQTSTISYLP